MIAGHGHPKVGDLLPNGATVVAYTKQYEGDGGTLPGGVVLAQRFDYHEPYVTWGLAITETGTRSTFGGHYFPTIIEAVEDYADRGGF